MLPKIFNSNNTRNQRIKFLLKFIAVASVLFVVIYLLEKPYELLIQNFISAYYQTFKNVFGLQPPQHLYVDLLMLQAVSFFALIIVTPQIPAKRKMKFFFIGILLFFGTDFLFTILDLTFQASYIWTLLAADFLKLALPILLWFAFSYNYLLKFFEEKTS